MGRIKATACEIDMTPMIDIVFQLIIFFVVTLKFNAEFNKDIKLADGKHGPTITAESLPPTVLQIEVARNGRVSISNAPLTEAQLRAILRNRVNRIGTDFPILIRGDYRAQHEKIRKVMDICTQSGIAKLSFVAVKDPRTDQNKK